MKLETVKLKRLSICNCGYACLDDSITVGTEYRIDRDSIKLSGFSYRCGKCHVTQKNIRVVMASQVIHPDRPMAPLPWDLFAEAN